MTTERKRQKFTPEFKQDAVALVTEQGHSIAKAAQGVDMCENNLRCWKKELEQETSGERLTAYERAGLARLRRENKTLRIEKEILKKPAPSLRKKLSEVRLHPRMAGHVPGDGAVCQVMRVSASAYYDWRGRGSELIDSETWQLCHRMKALFSESRQSLGSRQLMKQMRK